MFEPSTLLAAPRIKVEALLAPIAGTRFQPTGFPDLGAATYRGPDGRDLMLVESAQSMANRLEGTLWGDGDSAPHGAVEGLPYVAIADAEGRFLTSSRIEPHRLASAYVKKADFDGTDGTSLIKERLGLQDKVPLDHGRLHRAVFDLDPLALIHGVFFADKGWVGQPKIARVSTAFVEAEDVEPAFSGGVKRDHVSNSGKDSGGSTEGFGNVPFARTEYVAQRIVASFVIDVSQIQRYRLEDRERALLLAVSLLEVRLLLDAGLRLRTACDLEVLEVRGERPEGFELPSTQELMDAVASRQGGRQEPLVGVFSG